MSQIEKTVRLYRRTDRSAELETAKARHEARELSYYFDDDGSFVLRARLDAEQGALVAKALEAAMVALSSADDDSRESSPAAHRADALSLMAETLLAHGATGLPAGERHMVIVHVDAAVVTDAAADGQCALDHGPSLAPETVRRLCCDTSLVTVPNAPGTDVVSSSGWLSLHEANRQFGLAIDERTAGQSWRGEQPDYGYLVSTLVQRAQAETVSA